MPLGNPIGPADDQAQQRRILEQALAFAVAAPLPQSSVVLPVEWTGAPDWRDSYMAIDDLDALRAAGDARRAEQAARRQRSS